MTSNPFNGFLQGVRSIRDGMTDLTDSIGEIITAESAPDSFPPFRQLEYPIQHYSTLRMGSQHTYKVDGGEITLQPWRKYDSSAVYVAWGFDQLVHGYGLYSPTRNRVWFEEPAIINDSEYHAIDLPDPDSDEQNTETGDTTTNPGPATANLVQSFKADYRTLMSQSNSTLREPERIESVRWIGSFTREGMMDEIRKRTPCPVYVSDVMEGEIQGRESNIRFAVWRPKDVSTRFIAWSFYGEIGLYGYLHDGLLILETRPGLVSKTDDVFNAEDTDIYNILKDLPRTVDERVLEATEPDDTESN